MICRLKNTSACEVPITIRATLASGKYKYPGLVMHAGQTIDFALWRPWLNLMDCLFTLAFTSDDFFREFISGRMIAVQVAA